MIPKLSAIKSIPYYPTHFYFYVWLGLSLFSISSLEYATWKCFCILLCYTYHGTFCCFGLLLCFCTIFNTVALKSHQTMQPIPWENMWGDIWLRPTHSLVSSLCCAVQHIKDCQQLNINFKHTQANTVRDSVLPNDTWPTVLQTNSSWEIGMPHYLHWGTVTVYIHSMI